ncbi:MAG: hypothetical protein IPL41_10525 [Micropruina sp.]|nr:hypothetical protein [Micropruina sp.]
MTVTTNPSKTNAAHAADIPVSKANVRDCLDSARYWVLLLPAYANDKQRTADRWAIAAGLLAAVTSLTVWATLEESTSNWARAAVAIFSLATAVCALFPRVKNYGEMAGHARELSARYGQILGDLFNLWDHPSALSTPAAHEVITAFDAVKAAKDANLRDLPLKPLGTVPRDANGVALWPLNVYRIAKRGGSIGAAE